MGREFERENAVKVSRHSARPSPERPTVLPMEPSTPSMLPAGLRLGLCCQFASVPIKFRTTTVTACLRLDRRARLEKLAELCRVNAEALLASIEYCASHGIGSFRVNSQILPVKTHPEAGYRLEELPTCDQIVDKFVTCGKVAAARNIRLSLHPDQFVVLNSPREEVVSRSIDELEYQSEVAEWIGADVVNIHAGGAYGDKLSALDRLSRNLARLSMRARERLTLENDDVTYAPAELLPLCRRESVPLVYDVHHHRCLGDGLTIEDATEQAAATWNHEPMVHLSSPKEGWAGPGPERHHDEIDVTDFPACWWGRTHTIEVEAKAKELAIAKLTTDLVARFAKSPSPC
jgi:UV DNA damage endonuclease